MPDIAEVPVAWGDEHLPVALLVTPPITPGKKPAQLKET